MTVEPGIALVRVTKRYGSTLAVDQLTLRLDEGEVACLSGPNGSGKSTVLGMVAGLALPSSGEIRIAGFGVRSPRTGPNRPSIGYLPQTSVLYDHLTGLEHLRFLSQLYGAPTGAVARLEGELRALGLEACAHSPVRGYSQGMKRKLAFLAALAHEPRIILLDEPFAGVDAEGVSRAAELLRAAKVRGACMLIVTHRHDDFASLADRWLTLDRGRLEADRRGSVRPRDSLCASSRPPEDARPVPARAEPLRLG